MTDWDERQAHIVQIKSLPAIQYKTNKFPLILNEDCRLLCLFGHYRHSVSIAEISTIPFLPLPVDYSLRETVRQLQGCLSRRPGKHGPPDCTTGTK